MRDSAKRLWIAALGGTALLAVVVVSGVVPIEASRGHWPVTRWFLDFASSRSVSTHSAGIDVPPLDRADWVMLGAAAYESNCTFCHGRPGEPPPPVAARMTPAPPPLADARELWEPRELFYIVLHGIKFAGMPAWPGLDREDEVWPVVAFLRQLGDMPAERYRELVSPPLEPGVPPLVARACAACHGARGEGRAGDSVPVLAGQSAAYLRASLEAYGSGTRQSGVMRPIAARLSDDEMALASEWYASQGPVGPRGDPDSADAAAGRTWLEGSMRTRKVPVCTECHGTARDPRYPVLAGQPVEYLTRQLELFRSRRRGGTELAHRMHTVADALDEEQSRQIASYFASLDASAPEDDEERREDR